VQGTRRQRENHWGGGKKEGQFVSVMCLISCINDEGEVGAEICEITCCSGLLYVARPGY